MIAPAFLKAMEAGGMQMRFTRTITPMLKEAGVSQATIDAMLTENPRRYFAGEAIPHAH
jgi:predicted metal-dependent phosphotriesterase family hydrolase